MPHRRELFALPAAQPRGRGGARLPRGGRRARAARAAVQRGQGLDRAAAPRREGVPAGALPLPAHARRHGAQLPRGHRVPQPVRGRAGRAADHRLRAGVDRQGARHRGDGAARVAQPPADRHPARRDRRASLRRGVRRRAPRRGARAGEGADLQLSQRLRRLGPAQPAPGALEPLQRPHPARRARARVPDLQLDRARRVALHRARGARAAADLLRPRARGLRARRDALRDGAVHAARARRDAVPRDRPLPNGGRHELHGRGRVQRDHAAGRRHRDRRHADHRARADARRRPRLRSRDGGPQARGVLLMRAVETAERTAELLRFATAGSVDDGKSTLIGRLLYDSKSICEDQLEHVADASRRINGDNGHVDLALLTDGLRAEREQGITIDVAYRYFATPRRTFIIADTPGHILYTRNMVTGASTADLAVVLVDARKGVLEQSRRHAFIASLLGVRHLVVAVNKMDLVDWDERVFTDIVEDFSGFAAKLEVGDLTFIPLSALRGDNVVERSPNMPWYEGTPLLYHLEHVHIASDRNLIDARFPVQWVIRDPRSDYRGYAGQVAGGVWRAGDDVLVLPSGARSRVRSVEDFDGELEAAYPPMSVTLRLEDEVDVSRGDMLCRPHNHPEMTRELDAIVCWMSDRPATEGTRYVFKHTTRSGHCVLSEVVHRIDVETLHRDEAASELGLNEIGRITLRTSVPVVFDPYRRNRATGSLILIDEATNDTVGAVMLLGTAEAPAVEPTPRGLKSSNVKWEPTHITREDRQRSLGLSGLTIWLTGLPGSGKSTLAGGVEARLVDDRVLAYRLDGDNLRHGLNGNLGFDPADRAENVRRTAHAASLLADAGAVVLVSLVSPYRADRRLAREVHESAGLPFVEVFVDTPLELCEQRDPKGLYAKARRGEIKGMTGIDDPYEPPDAPELVVRPEAPDVLVEQVLELLRSRELI